MKQWMMTYSWNSPLNLRRSLRIYSSYFQCHLAIGLLDQGASTNTAEEESSRRYWWLPVVQENKHRLGAPKSSHLQIIHFWVSGFLPLIFVVYYHTACGILF